MRKYRFIPRNYGELCKEYAQHPMFWEEASELNNKIMLGGEYYQKGKAKGGFIKLINVDEQFRSTKHISLLVESDKVKTCPFKVGDQVVCSPKDGGLDITDISQYKELHLDDTQKAHIVVHILNNYYIFLDYENYKEKGFPFRWEDFEKINS